MVERFSEQPRDILGHTDTFSLDRSSALKIVLDVLGLEWRVVASAGAKYPDGTEKVPEGMEYLTYDTGAIPPPVIFRRVDRLAPMPRDGKRQS